MNLVGQVGEPDVTHELFADDAGKARCVSRWHQRRARTVGHAAVGNHVAVARGGVGVRHLEAGQGWRREETGKRKKILLSGLEQRGGKKTNALVLVCPRWLGRVWVWATGAPDPHQQC